MKNAWVIDNKNGKLINFYFNQYRRRIKARYFKMKIFRLLLKSWKKRLENRTSKIDKIK